MRVLDVAAGSGALSIPAAQRGARVLATDISPPMVERLLVRARTAGLLDLEARVMDGYALDLEDDTFDLTASQNGVSVFPDFARGLAEMVRVTRPGGQVMIVSLARELTLITDNIGELRRIEGFILEDWSQR